MSENQKRDQMRVSVLNTRQEQDHFHQDTELFYILKGSMDIEVMGRSSHLAAEDILAVNAGERYGYRASEDILFARPSVPVQLLKNTVQNADIAFWCDSSRRESNQYAQLRYDEVPQEEAEKIMMSEMQKCPALFGTLSSMYGFVQFRKTCTAELEGLKKIIPYCFEMHGKCHYVDENLHEVSIPYEEIIPVVAASGYEGYIVTEFEDEGGYDTIEQTGRHVAMVKKLLRQCE